MAVFPKRLILKNSADTDAAIRAAIGAGGSDEILPGEVVVSTATGAVKFYTRDEAGNIVTLGEGSASNPSSQCIVSAVEPTQLPDGNPLVDGFMWFNTTDNSFHVYYNSAWVQISGGSGGGGSGTVTSVDASGTGGISVTGGPITTSGTLAISLDDTTVTPGAYTSADITIDAQGRITAASNGSGGVTSIDDLSDVDTSSPGHVPTDGQSLVWDDGMGHWMPGTVSGGIEEAPEDGTPYVRQDAGWVSASGSGGAVDSVNGQTGVVSLGIQDMNDYEPNMPETGGLRYIFNSSDSTPPSGGVYQSLSSSGSDSRFNIWKPTDADGNSVASLWDTLELGDIITISFDPDGVDYVANGPITDLILSASYNRVVFTLGGVSPQPFVNGDGRSIYFASAKLGVFPVELQEGDILKWNDNDQKFRPFPASDLGAVESVNTQTGVVSLGILDMDDVEVNTLSPDVFRYDKLNDTGSFGSGYNEPGEAQKNYGQTLFNPVDADGKDTFAALVAANGGVVPTTSADHVDYWVSIDGGETWTYNPTGSTFVGQQYVANSVLINPVVWTYGETTEVRIAFTDPAQHNAPIDENDRLAWSVADQKFTLVSGSLGGLADVDVTTAPPTDSQALVWDAVSEEWKPGTPSSGATRKTVSVTTSNLGLGVSEDLTVTNTGKAGQLLAIEADASAWIVVYTSSAARTTDASRTETTDPSPGSGVLAEVITTGSERISVTPCINFFNDESVPVSELYIKVTNKEAPNTAVEVTLTVVPTEG